MEIKKQSDVQLNKIPADRRAVAELYAHGQINAQAVSRALKFLYPYDQWGVWIARILLFLGSSLLLAGVVYFFAFNWARISPMVKFGMIEAGLFGCLAGAVILKVQSLGGKLLLLSASVLVGVFLAVYGQVYQTGADAYQIFMAWAILISGWVVISNFVALWLIWLIVLNLFAGFYWDQAAFPSKEMEMMIFFYLALLNSAFLFAGEFVARKGVVWMQARWVRAFIAFIVLGISFAPMVMFVGLEKFATFSIIVSAALGLALHIAIFLLYRYKFHDMWILAMTLLSGCVLAVFAAIRFITQGFKEFEPIILLFLGVITMVIFALSALYLRKTNKAMEALNES